MSAYQPRKGPNVSQYMASVNATASSTAEDSAAARSDGFGIDDGDLDLFMHTEFLDDFDDDFANPLGPTLDQPPIKLDPGQPPHQSGTSPGLGPAAPATGAAGVATLGGGAPSTNASNVDMKNLNFDDDFQFNGLSYLPNGNAQLQGVSNQTYGTSAGQDFDLTFPPTSPYAIQSFGKASITPSPPNGKRIAETDPAALEANSRAAAEEDKRRRNTAASARFRIKKKQREQALEKTAKEMTDKCEQLEQRVDQLERENNWLKGLVVEKTAKGGDEVAELWNKFREEGKDRSTNSTKKGVGTADD